MGLNVEGMIKELQDHVGVDNVDLPDNDAKLFLNRSFWEILDKFKFKVKEGRFNINTVIDQQAYPVDVSTTEAIQGLYIDDPTLDYNDKKIIKISLNEFLKLSIPRTGRPTHYTRENNNLLLHPTPDQVYKIIVTRLLILDDLVTGDIVIPRSWHELILYGGIARYYVKEKDWPNATMMQNLQNSKINTAIPVESKENTDNTRSGVRMWNDRFRRMY